MSIGSVADKALVTTAAVGIPTAPWWLEYLNYGGAAIVIVCGVGVGILRLLIAWRDWRNKE
jgi:hypothetical protein